MAKDAWYFLVPLLLLAALAWFVGWMWGALVLLGAGVFVAFFFRDPDRAIPADPLAIVSPADGRVIKVQSEAGGGSRLSIFLSVFNVHVNRAPIEGEIIRQEHRPGRFHVASDDRASVENEQLVITIRGRRDLTFSLIAGIVARRIVPWRNPGDTVGKGDRIALIRFGSRADLMIPADCELSVKPGDRVYAGKSVIARWGEDR
jgi:phosphatidylserine decarboxylase